MTGRVTDHDWSRITFFFASLLFWSVFAYFTNWLLLLLWFVTIGWVLLIIDAIAKTRMCRDIFLPAGSFKVFHPLKGTLFGWTGVLVPFRLAWRRC